MAEIRELQSEDNLDDLIRLSRDFFTEYEVHHSDFFDIDTLRDEDIADFFCRSIDCDNNRTFIAIEDDEIVGYITISVRPQPSFYKIRNVGAISGLMVHKDYRRRGIATQLLSKARTFFEKKNVNYFTVYTATANKGATKFYKKNGMALFISKLIGEVSKTIEET